MQSSNSIEIAPWLPGPADLARLAMEAADAAGLGALRAWPVLEKGGVSFGGLPPFLPWRGRTAGGQHLVLLQPRELGALVPGARPAGLPAGWLEALALEDLARPLGRHPDFPAGAAVHVVACLEPGRARVRSSAGPCPELVGAVLARLTGTAGWRVCQL
jgi:hypothetical protein